MGARFVVRVDGGVRYVLDTKTGQMRPGLSAPGARQLADHLNRQAKAGDRKAGGSRG